MAALFSFSGGALGFDYRKTVTPESARPPMLFFQGHNDLPSSRDGTIAMLAHFNDVGVRYDFAWVPGFSHFYPAGAAILGRNGSKMTVEERAMEFLEETVGRE